jgi:hypothetical protein
MATALGGLKQLAHFVRIKKVLATFVRISRVANATFVHTLYISPFGHHLPTPRKALCHSGQYSRLFTKYTYCKEYDRFSWTIRSSAVYATSVRNLLARCL